MSSEKTDKFIQRLDLDDFASFVFEQAMQYLTDKVEEGELSDEEKAKIPLGLHFGVAKVVDGDAQTEMFSSMPVHTMAQSLVSVVLTMQEEGTLEPWGKLSWEPTPESDQKPEFF